MGISNLLWHLRNEQFFALVFVDYSPLCQMHEVNPHQADIYLFQIMKENNCRQMYKEGFGCILL